MATSGGYAGSLERKLAAVQANQQHPQEFQWAPAIGEPGFSADGNHNWDVVREQRASQQRQAEELRQYTLAANKTKEGQQYEWDPAPGDPNFS